MGGRGIPRLSPRPHSIKLPRTIPHLAGEPSPEPALDFSKLKPSRSIDARISTMSQSELEKQNSALIQLEMEIFRDTIEEALRIEDTWDLRALPSQTKETFTMSELADGTFERSGNAKSLLRSTGNDYGRAIRDASSALALINLAPKHGNEALNQATPSNKPR